MFVVKQSAALLGNDCAAWLSGVNAELSARPCEADAARTYQLTENRGIARRGPRRTQFSLDRGVSDRVKILHNRSHTPR